MKNIAIALGIIQCFVAFWAIPAGILLILQPDGSGIGLPLEIVKEAPFSDFLIPGIILLIVNGFFNVVGALFSFKLKQYAGKIGEGLGVFLLLWILVQVYYTKGFINFLQPLFLAIGFLEIILGTLLIQKTKTQTKQ